LGTAVSDELGRAAANDVSLPVPRSGPDAWSIDGTARRMTLVAW